MKTFFLATMLATALGPLLIAIVEPENRWASEFSFAMVGGTGGAMLCLVLYETTDIKQMARDAIGNFLTAACFGPGAAYFIGQAIGIVMCPQLIIPTSAGLGFCGATLIRIAKPAWLKAWESWNAKRADDISGR